MRAPKFWWTPPGLASAALNPIAAVYGTIASARMNKLGTRVGVPIICVGDPTVGGSGKTPTAIAIARLLKALGELPCFVTRGYGGRVRGPRLVDPNADVAEEVGDEPLLLAQIAPTIVSKDRLKGAELAAKSGASVIVLDDGFQNPALAKDLSLLVVDGTMGVGNACVFPAGPLRAPILTQIEHAQAVILIGQGQAGDIIAYAASEHDVPVFTAMIRPSSDVARQFAGQRVLAFAGIGRPEKFFTTLEAVGAMVVERRVFPDHHVYSDAEAQALIEEAKAKNLGLATTEKDLVRCAREPTLRKLVAAARALPIELQFDDVEKMQQLIDRSIKR